MKRGTTILAVTSIIILMTGLVAGDVAASEPAMRLGPPLSQFLTPEVRLDLEAAQRSGYEGPLDLSGFSSRLDPQSGELIFQPRESGATSGLV